MLPPSSSASAGATAAAFCMLQRHQHSHFQHRLRPRDKDRRDAGYVSAVSQHVALSLLSAAVLVVRAAAMLGSRARQRQRQQAALFHTRLLTPTSFNPHITKQMIDNLHNTTSTTSADSAVTTLPSPTPTHTLFTASTPPLIHPIHDASKAKPNDTLNAHTASSSSAPAASLRRSTFSSTYLRRILASLYSPASYLATAIHNSAPTPPFDPTEPPLSPRSAALASAVAYPFPAAPAVYSVPFIINDQICIVPYVPLPRPAGYETTSRPSTPPSSAAAHSYSPLSPTRSSPLHSPLSPPSPPSPALYSLLPEQSLQLGEQWLSVLSPASLSAHFHPNLYAKLLHSPTPYQSHITKDITRTFPSHPLFQQHKTRANAVQRVGCVQQLRPRYRL